MFERFTERARQVVVLAQDEARAPAQLHRHPAHPARGLLREEEGLAAREPAPARSRGLIGLAVAFLLGVLTGRARRRH